MPVITIQTFEGKAPAQKQAFIERVTDAAVDILKVSRDSVVVIIEEHPRQNWGWGGRLGSDMFPPKTEGR
jgi:4-oxalocrotonate tautomerase